MRILFAVLNLLSSIATLYTRYKDEQAARGRVNAENQEKVQENVKRAQDALNGLDDGKRDKLRDKYKNR